MQFPAPSPNLRWASYLLSCALLAGGLTIASVPAAAQRQPGSQIRPAPAADGSVQVLLRGRLETGVMAIGGETTGTTVDTGGFTFELELQNQPQLRRAVERLDGQRVVVEGELQQRRGVERGRRLIVQPRRIEQLGRVDRPRGDRRDWEDRWDRYPGRDDWRDGRNRGGWFPGTDRRSRDRDWADRWDDDRRDGDRWDDGPLDDGRGDRDDRDRGDDGRGDRDPRDRDPRDRDDPDRRDRSIRINLGRLLQEALQ